MSEIFPFIYEPKKEQFEPIPLYAELIVPEYQEESSQEEDIIHGVIIIDIF